MVDFPLFMWDDQEQRWFSSHHPLPAPADEELDRLESDPGRVRSKAYDMVLNGSEIGGGSIRIHDQSMQAAVFELLGISDEEAEEKFGFLLRALEYGCPPHGGIAFGLDGRQTRAHPRGVAARVTARFDGRGTGLPDRLDVAGIGGRRFGFAARDEDRRRPA